LPRTLIDSEPGAALRGAGTRLRLAPSVVRRFGERFSLELGITADLTVPRRTDMKLATWVQF